MRTTLVLDEGAVRAAQAVAPGKTKTAIVNEALREYARRRQLARFAHLGGTIRWDGNLEELRRRPQP